MSVDYRKEYKSIKEVQERAEQIKNIPFGELEKIEAELGSNAKIVKTKSSVGDLFEGWFGKQKDSSSEPDLGIVELKTTPYKKLKSGKYSAKERLVLNIINYMDIVNEDFDDSHFLEKNGKLELAFYEYVKDKPRKDWFFSDVVYFEMSKKSLDFQVDFQIIKHDWNKIKQYVVEGRAHEINEGMTQYLSACTKGASAKSVRQQPYSDIKAKQRAFSLKSSYMTQLVRDFLFGDKKAEYFIKDANELKEKSLSEIIEEKLEPYVGIKTTELFKKFDLTYIGKNGKPIKQINNLLVKKMLSIESKDKKELTKDYDNIVEFNKAGYLFKTIQFDYKGTNKESMSFPAFDFCDLVSQTWNDEDENPSADLHRLLVESTFVFLVFQTDKDGANYFRGVKIFKVPEADIEGPIRQAWEDTVQVLKDGVKLKYIVQGNRKRVENNFITKHDNKCVHVRPHAAKSSYVESKDSSRLPIKAQWENKPADYSEWYMTKQCFWLNNDYIRNAVDELVHL